MTAIQYLFDKTKPFYPIVMTYLISLHGLKEVAAIGALGSDRTWHLATKENTGVLRLGDPITLLWDIEQIHPEMSIL